MPHFDPREKAPHHFRLLFRALQKGLPPAVDVLDLRCLSDVQRSQFNYASPIDHSLLQSTFHAFAAPLSDVVETPAVALESRALPGLVFLPSLLPCSVQSTLLDKLLHRDLSDPGHQTNLHAHHHVPYAMARIDGDDSMVDGHVARSFFSMDPNLVFAPKDDSTHKPLLLKQILEKRLRWLTLGGQYDWTAKQYPLTEPPPFPNDIARLLHGLFPRIQPQAAIVNFYSPGDNLSIHRDGSEDSDRDLISVSLGCDAIFIVAAQSGDEMLAAKLRSGDVVVMSGQSRYAWHAVPKITPDTCPVTLADWPATKESRGRYEHYRGWLGRRRVNLNVRQMFD